MRTKNSLKNIAISLTGQIMLLAVNFFARRVFLDVLGEDYLGINGLFSNVVTMLSLADLGLASAIIYSLYRYVAADDEENILRLINFYRSAYIIVGITVLAAGVAIIPLLPYIIKADGAVLPDGQQAVYFAIFLANSVISYFFAYRQSLIIAHQQKYIVSAVNIITNLLLSAAQVAALLLTGSFALFLVLAVGRTIAENLIVWVIAAKKYPYVKHCHGKKLDREQRVPIFRNIRAMLFHKIGTIVILGSTSIVISAFVGIREVGYYSNYMMIISALNLLFTQFFDSATASVGNLAATQGRQKTYTVYKSIYFANAWFSAFCFICLYILFNPFISLWLGEELLFSAPVVLMLCLNFYVTTMRRTNLMFRDAMGLFWNDRFKPIAEAVLGIGMAIGFSYLWGTFGVLAGFTIAMLVTACWIEPYVLYKHGFGRSLSQFFVITFRYLLLAAVSFAATYFVCSFVTGITWTHLILRGSICLIVPNAIFFVAQRHSAEWSFFKDTARSLLADKIRKNNGV